MKTNLFEIFKIGIGPSSSHTVGPMVAARKFVLKLAETGQLEAVCRVRTELYESLAHTGKGHGTDRAVILGLCGEQPETVDPGKASGFSIGFATRGPSKSWVSTPSLFPSTTTSSSVAISVAIRPCPFIPIE